MNPGSQATRVIRPGMTCETYPGSLTQSQIPQPFSANLSRSPPRPIMDSKVPSPLQLVIHGNDNELDDQVVKRFLRKNATEQKHAFEAVTIPTVKDTNRLVWESKAALHHPGTQICRNSADVNRVFQLFKAKHNLHPSLGKIRIIQTAPGPFLLQLARLFLAEGYRVEFALYSGRYNLVTLVPGATTTLRDELRSNMLRHANLQFMDMSGPGCLGMDLWQAKDFRDMGPSIPFATLRDKNPTLFNLLWRQCAFFNLLNVKPELLFSCPRSKGELFEEKYPNVARLMPTYQALVQAMEAGNGPSINTAMQNYCTAVINTQQMIASRWRLLQPVKPHHMSLKAWSKSLTQQAKAAGLNVKQIPIIKSFKVGALGVREPAPDGKDADHDRTRLNDSVPTADVVVIMGLMAAWDNSLFQYVGPRNMKVEFETGGSWSYKGDFPVYNTQEPGNGCRVRIVPVDASDEAHENFVVAAHVLRQTILNRAFFSSSSS